MFLYRNKRFDLVDLIVACAVVHVSLCSFTLGYTLYVYASIKRVYAHGATENAGLEIDRQKLQGVEG